MEYIKNFYNLTTKTNNPIKTGYMTGIHTFPKDIFKWPKSTSLNTCSMSLAIREL
jgi:hypothetical protein